MHHGTAPILKCIGTIGKINVCMFVHMWGYICNNCQNAPLSRKKNVANILGNVLAPCTCALRDSADTVVIMDTYIM